MAACLTGMPGSSGTARKNMRLSGTCAAMPTTTTLTALGSAALTEPDKYLLASRQHPPKAHKLPRTGTVEGQWSTAVKETTMLKLRLLLLPFALIVELALMAACGGCAFLRFTKAAHAILDWSVKTLPSVDWYIGK